MKFIAIRACVKPSELPSLFFLFKVSLKILNKTDCNNFSVLFSVCLKVTDHLTLKAPRNKNASENVIC